MCDKEVWKDVVGYEGIYRVSSKGVVERCDNYHSVNWPLKPGKKKTGYLSVALCRNGKCATFAIHILVARAFIGPANNLEVNHIDGDKANNSVGNLEYLTHKDNMHHALHVIDVITPTRARGMKNGCSTKPEATKRGTACSFSKLTEDKVRAILKLLKAGHLEQREIASMFSISQTQIWRIKCNTSWRHVERE